MDSTISVILCTHNPREDYLRRTLDAVEKQTLPKDQWELLLIDNSSKEPLAGKWDLSWHSQGRHVLEEELGLTPARLRGIREARGGLLVFVDDDNILAPDYLERVLDIADRHPFLGAFGAGVLKPEFETEPDPAFVPYLGYLALRTIKMSVWSNDSTDPIIPWGAGLVVRQQLAHAYQRVVNSCRWRRSLDRKGDSLVSAGDDEFSKVACGMGMGKGIFIELDVTHLISAKRLEKAYLLRLAEANAYSHVILNHLHGVAFSPLPPEPPPSTVVDVLSALAKVSVSRFFYHGNRWWQARGKVVDFSTQFREARSLGEGKALAELNLIHESE
jgi:glycosyltransferase involved in cell wall biosynthesis